MTGLVIWAVRPSDGHESAPAADDGAAASPTTTAGTTAGAQLQNLLPDGYPATACTPSTPPPQAITAVQCGANRDAGGPTSATYALFDETPALNAAFYDVTETSRGVECPGRIQSPGPWRRTQGAKTAGLLYCGYRGDRAVLAWTDDSSLVLSTVESDSGRTSFPALYRWWSLHS